MNTLDLTSDLDKSGNAFQRTKVYLGPTLGWVEVFVQPSQLIDAAGTYDLGAGSSMVFVDVAGAVIFNLPNLTDWMQQTANPTEYNPASGFAREIWIKDLGYNASANNITINAHAGQTIDGEAQFTIVQDGQLIRLYPLNDLSGWFVG